MEISAFQQSYRWEVLPSVPPGRKAIVFPADSPFDSLEYLVEITPDEGDPWIGNFTSSGFNFESGVLPTPNPEIVCINSKGAVYFVNVYSPSNYVEAPFVPVNEVESFYQYGFLLLIGFTKVAVYDRGGIRWTTKVSKDGIKISVVTKEKIDGLAWDPAKDRYVDFKIEIKTGHLLGGSAY